MPKNKKDKVSGVQMGINNPDPNSLPSSLFLISLRTKFTLILYIKTILRATYFIKKFQIFRSVRIRQKPQAARLLMFRKHPAPLHICSNTAFCYAHSFI